MPWKPLGTRTGRWVSADRLGSEIGGVEDQQIAGSAGAVVGEGEQVPLVLAGGSKARDEDGLTTGVAVGQSMGEPRAAAGEVVAVDLWMWERRGRGRGRSC